MFRLFTSLSVVAVLALVFVPASEAADKAAKKGKKAEELLVMIYKKADANNDEKVTKEELTAIVEFLKEKFADKAPDAEKLDKFFLKADANSDGSLSMDELKAAGPLVGKAKGDKKKKKNAV